MPSLIAVPRQAHAVQCRASIPTPCYPQTQSQLLSFSRWLPVLCRLRGASLAPISQLIQSEDIDQPFNEPLLSATGFNQPSDIALLWDPVRADKRIIHNLLQRVTDDSNVIARLVDHDRLHTRQVMWLKRAVDNTRTACGSPVAAAVQPADAPGMCADLKKASKAPSP